MIDLDALAALRAVATQGSVVGAAAALGFTPSAVSQQVKRLERQTGVRLLERVGRGVMLTHAGRHLVDEGARLLTDLEALEAGLHRQSGAVAGRVRLATFSTAMRGLVAPVVRDLLAAHPDLSLTLTEQEPWETIDEVATGQAELGVVHSWGDVPLEIPGHLVTTALTRDVADVIVHRDHPLAGRSVVTPADLVDEGWIATPEGTICRQWLTRMYDGTGRLPRIAHVSMEFESHLALVRAGLGIALIPRLGRSALGDDLVAVPAAEPRPVREIIALHRHSMAASPAVAAVLAALAGASPAESRAPAEEPHTLKVS
ncbi:LysR family transcriptional regulator [Nocardioides sp. KR10-350]|uniref:LysR family transcriptional regulator n=1 Tax=Nocardioides cheoyonin TaxID=3156615 RepID=UPI0032B59C3A